MDGVGTPIIGRPRPLPGHDTPNPAYHPHTLNYEEPDILPTSIIPTPPMVLPKPSTGALNIYADLPSDLRNLTNYIARCLLETGGFRPQLHPQL